MDPKQAFLASNFLPAPDRPIAKDINKEIDIEWSNHSPSRVGRRSIYIRHIKIFPLQASLVLGLRDALVQAYFKVIPPLGYGVCMVCHPKDLFNWVADHILNLIWSYSS